MSMANLDILLRNQMVNLNILIQILNVSNRTKKCESYTSDTTGICFEV